MSWINGTPGIIPPEAFRIGSRLSADGTRFESFYCVRSHAPSSSRRSSTSSSSNATKENSISVEKVENTTWYYGSCVGGLNAKAMLVIDGALVSQSTTCQYLVSSSSYEYYWIDGSMNRYISHCVLHAPVDDEVNVAITRVLYEEELCLGLYFLRNSSQNDMNESIPDGVLLYSDKELIPFDSYSDFPIEFLS